MMTLHILCTYKILRNRDVYQFLMLISHGMTLKACLRVTCSILNPVSINDRT